MSLDMGAKARAGFSDALTGTTPARRQDLASLDRPADALSLASASPVQVAEEVTRGAVAYSSVVFLRTLFNSLELNTVQAVSRLPDNKKLDALITETHKELLDFKVSGTPEALERATVALNSLVGHLRERPDLAPSLGDLTNFLETIQANLSESSEMSGEALRSLLDKAEESAQRVLCEAAPDQLSAAYVENCSSLFTFCREALMEYANFAEVSPGQKAVVAELAGALRAAADGKHESIGSYKRALESVLEHSSTLHEQGLSCSALEIAIALSAERLASMQLGRLVVCARQGPHNSDGIPHEVWRTALGDEIKLAPAVRALTESFTLVNTREADLPDIVADRTAFLEEERSLLTAVRDAITTIARHRQLGLRGAGTLAVPPDTHVAKQSFIKTLVSQPGELFSRVSALLKLQAFVLACATLPGAITHSVSGSASGLYYLSGAAAIGCAVFDLLYAQKHNRLLDTSASTNGSVLDAFFAYCKENGVDDRRSGENEISWSL